MKRIFSIVLPIYGNEKNLPITIPYIIDHLHLFSEYDVELLLINDGSPDESWKKMCDYQRRYPKVIRIAQFTRNFGQLAAWRCGMDMARGDVIGFISADLQDPFELFVDMLKWWEEGYPIVIASRDNRNEKGVSIIFSKVFQRLVHTFIDRRYPNGGFDFFIIDKSVKEQYSRLHKSNVLTQLWLLWLGDKTKEIQYTRKKREVGKTGYTFFMKIEMGMRVFTLYSKFLINAILSLGLLFFVLSIAIGIVSIILWLNQRLCSTLMQMFLVGSFFSGIHLIAVAFIGNYLWNTMNYCKNNPPYLVEEIIEE